MKKIFTKNFHMAHVILPIITLFCLAGFIGSLLFPKAVLDTYKVNVAEEEGDAEFTVPLSEDTEISYEMNTTGRPMKGIQVGISKEGASQENVYLCYQVYEHSMNEEVRYGELLSDNRYHVAMGDEVQYVYLPFENWENCKGDIIVSFSLEGAEEMETAPALLANHTLIDNTRTLVGNEMIDGSLKSMYIYTHDTYPLLYDFRLLTFVFLAASMAVSYPKLQGKGGSANEK